MDHTSLLVPRLTVLLVAPIEFAVVAWYFLYWDLFPKYSIRRLLPWLIFLLTGVAVPLVQISIYRGMTSVTKVDDPFVGIVIFMESMGAVALAFYLLIRRRSRDKISRG